MKKGDILVSVLVYLVFVSVIIFIMFGKLEITKNEFVDFQKTEKARINAINASNLARAYISNYADAVLGLLRVAGFSSHQVTFPGDIKSTGDSIVNEIMSELEEKKTNMVEMFKDETREDPYDWLWILHKNFSDSSDTFNSVNLIKITKNDQEYNIEDILSKEGVLDLFVVFAKDNKNIALILSRSKFLNKSFIVYSLVGKDTLAKYGAFLNSWPGGYWTSNYKFYGDVRLNAEPNVEGQPEIFGDYYAPDLDDDGRNWHGSGSFDIKGENYFIGGDELNKYNFDGISKDYGNILEYGSSERNRSPNDPFALVIDIAKMERNADSKEGDADYKEWVKNLYKLIKPEGYMKGLWIRNKIVRILIPQKVEIKVKKTEINFPIDVLADVDNDGVNERVELALAIGETDSSNFSSTDEIIAAFKKDENSPDITLKFFDKVVGNDKNDESRNYTGHFVYYDESDDVWKMFESPIATIVSGETWPEALDPSTLIVHDVKLTSQATLNPSEKIYEIINAQNQDDRTSPYWKTLRIYGKDQIKNKEDFVFETFPFQFNGIIDFDKHDIILGDTSGQANEDLCLVDGKYTLYTKGNIYQISSIIYQDYAKKVRERFGTDLYTAAQIIDNYPQPYNTYDLGEGKDMIDYLRANSDHVDDFLNLVCEGKYRIIGNSNNFGSLDISENDDMKLFGAIYAIDENSELTSNYSNMYSHSTFWIYGSAVLQTEGITEESWGWFDSGGIGYSLSYAHDERIKRGIAAWNYGTPGAPSEIQVYGMGVLEK